MGWIISKITNEKWYVYGRGLNSKIRRAIMKKYNNTCQHCKKQYPIYDDSGKFIPFEIHHIKAKSLEGEENIENLLLLCRNCHRKFYHSGKNSPYALHKKISSSSIRKPQ